MIESIERDGTKVLISIDSGVKVERRILKLAWETGSEMYAELLKDQLWDQLAKFKEEIAKNPQYYLGSEGISKLKSKLVHEWDGSKHCWK